MGRNARICGAEWAVLQSHWDVSGKGGMRGEDGVELGGGMALAIAC